MVTGYPRFDGRTDSGHPLAPEQFTEQITTVARRLLDLAVTEPHLMRVMLNQAPAVAPAAVDALTDQLSAATAAYLTLGVEAGYLRHDLDAAAVADAMTGVALPAIKRVLRGQLDDASREQTAVAIGRFIATGAAAESSST